MRVVVAVDKFKGSLSADQAGRALERGILRADPDVQVARVPVADGGDGTLAVAIAAGFERVDATVEGPTGAPVVTAYARRGDTAVIELADASGLARLDGELAPMRASTFGTGQLLAAAIDAGCTEVILGVGGSSSTDGGAGLVIGLGAEVTDALGEPVRRGGVGLASAARLDVKAMRSRLSGVHVILACDVDNTLLGPDGAARVYGPQKGAGPAEVAELERGLRVWAEVVAAAVGRDVSGAAGAGAAGGTGFAALALLGAECRSGIGVVLDLIGFDQAVEGADLIVTGEGSLDGQSLRGKAPMGVLAAARRHGVPVDAVCGRMLLTPAELGAAGLRRTWVLADREPDVRRSMRNAEALLEVVGSELIMDLRNDQR